MNKELVKFCNFNAKKDILKLGEFKVLENDAEKHLKTLPENLKKLVDRELKITMEDKITELLKSIKNQFICKISNIEFDINDPDFRFHSLYYEIGLILNRIEQFERVIRDIDHKNRQEREYLENHDFINHVNNILSNELSESTQELNIKFDECRLLYKKEKEKE